MASFLILIYLTTNTCKECCTTSPKQARASSRSSTRFIPQGPPPLPSHCLQTFSHCRASGQYLCSNPYPTAINRSRLLSRQQEVRTLKLTGLLEANKFLRRMHPLINNNLLREGRQKIYILPKVSKPGPLLIIIMNSSRNMCFSNKTYLSKSNKNCSRYCILK